MLFGKLSIILSLVTSLSASLDHTNNTEKPYPTSVFQQMHTMGFDTSSKYKLSTKVNQKIQLEDTTITITDVLYDGINIYIGYQTRPYNKVYHDYHFSFKVNGKPMDGFGYSIDQRKINNSQGANILTLTPRNPLNSEFELSLYLNQKNSKQNLTSSMVELPIKKIKGVKSYSLSLNKSLQGNRYSIKKVVFSPIVTAIIFDAEISVHDHNSIKYLLFNNEIMLNPLGSGGGGGPEKDGKIVTRNIARFEPLEKLPKRLVFQAVKVQNPKNGSNKLLEKPLSKLPLSLKQGEVGSIKVTEIKNGKNYTKIYYEVEGKEPYKQATAFFLKDDANQKYDMLKPPDRLSDDEYKFVATFEPTNQTDNLSIVSAQLKKPVSIDTFKVEIKLEK
ncbi:DUF4179 domain-containing protein [Alkalihalobacillus sp. AL-G]|uniref:DUF4179 domain-containing protein n=1 Tax=Alkalihalobacillus sp. AL-G TaxID=2926399 RepID=UPI00272ABFCB|nr:DUF4179 domain-containing protein [Alkalihalobacillus sp. AL-G]WLD91727.1 DUF4179 domain-containing protein [Alkalihalobacillus sp. AL-G]